MPMPLWSMLMALQASMQPSKASASTSPLTLHSPATSTGDLQICKCTSGDSSTATSNASTVQGAELGSATSIGGVGSIGGQVDFSGTADAANVTGNAQGNGTLGSAQGLVTGEAASGFGTSISSDGTLQGFAINSISSDAATTNGVAGANTTITSIDGANLGDVSIGGVGSLLGQSSLTGSAAASNVEGGSSTAQNSLGDADGLDATSSLQISSDGSISGLNNGSLAASAESTGVTGATTTAQASSSAGTLKGAVLGTTSPALNPPPVVTLMQRLRPTTCKAPMNSPPLGIGPISIHQQHYCSSSQRHSILIATTDIDTSQGLEPSSTSISSDATLPGHHGPRLQCGSNHPTGAMQ